MDVADQDCGRFGRLDACSKSVSGSTDQLGRQCKVMTGRQVVERQHSAKDAPLVTAVAVGQSLLRAHSGAGPLDRCSMNLP